MTDKDRIALLEAEIDRLKECVDEIAQRPDVGAGARLFFQLLTAKSATLTHASPERADEGAYSCGHGIRLTEVCPKCHPERAAPADLEWDRECVKCGRRWFEPDDGASCPDCEASAAPAGPAEKTNGAPAESSAMASAPAGTDAQIAAGRLLTPQSGQPGSTTEPSATGRVLLEVNAERDRQDAKWGVQNHPDGTCSAWLREFFVSANTARQACDNEHRSGRGTYASILAEEVAEAMEAAGSDLRKELVQVAAVAVGWIECIDRRASPAQPEPAALPRQGAREPTPHHPEYLRAVADAVKTVKYHCDCTHAAVAEIVELLARPEGMYGERGAAPDAPSPSPADVVRRALTAMKRVPIAIDSPDDRTYCAGCGAQALSPCDEGCWALELERARNDLAAALAAAPTAGAEEPPRGPVAQEDGDLC